METGILMSGKTDGFRLTHKEIVCPLNKADLGSKLINLDDPH